MANAKIYAMNPGKTDQLVSWSAALVLVVVAIIMMCVDDIHETWPAIVTLVLVEIGCVGYGLATSPQHIIVDSEGMGIRWRTGGRFVALSDIKSVEWYDKDPMRKPLVKSTRTVGNGGMFGYTGRWYNREIGHFHIYARRLKGVVLVELANGKKVIVSCDEPQALVDDLTSRIGLTSK